MSFFHKTSYDDMRHIIEISKEFLHYQISHVRNTLESRCYCCPIGLNKEYERIRNKHFVIPNIINLLIGKDNLFDDENIEIYTGGDAVC